MGQTNSEEKLRELIREFEGLVHPQYRKLAALTRQAHDNNKRLKQSVNSLQESLDYLRICIKYQLFDLEATRRENKSLRRMLEERSD